MEQNILVLDFKMAYNTYMNITYKSNNNVVYSCKYHVVWCPKYRCKILTNSYFVSTVGGAPLDVIKQYIENQKISQRQKDKLG